MKKSKLNLPNALSLLRVILVPFFMAAIIFMNGKFGIWGRVVPAIIFALTGLTDMLDGKIARKYNLVTDFGKFIDPLADKFMVFGALIAILTSYSYIASLFVWVSAVVMLRELAITSLRLVVAGKSGIVIAASWWGKVKTATQIVALVVIILEPVVFGKLYNVYDNPIASYVAMAAILITTVGSGISYIKAYWPHLDTNK
ncbi:MAG: CDP-diacylglycerol--glycerol-3-phosphate 3-phosphatidyltransferase [Clostridia bacterium]|nr:CDP-diacylglycerol--glycerol-3-phosphate 3-phosphatidyltransferase [Clostridia bacterium]